jgi:Deoxyribodipyrimidine photolyase
LRLTDNPALIAASENDVLPVYILDSEDLKDMGQASKLWLHHSLNQLNETLEGKLHFIQGDSINEIRKLIDSEQIDAIYWNRVFEPKKRSKDNDLIKSLEIDYHIFNGSLLWEPESILKDDGTPYKVFTPFYRKGCIKAGKTPREPLPKAKLNFISAEDQTSLDELNLLPVHPWKKKIESKWEMGEDSAMKRLDDFLENGIQNYKEGRNYPAKSFVSRLSPHLHFGELSPNQIWFKTRAMGDDKNIDHFCSELGWREFSHYLIHHFSFMLKENLNSNFDAFPWENNADFIQSWKLGETGYPIVDAGMKELWENGLHAQ